MKTTVKIKKVTIKAIREHFNEQGYTPKHEFAGLKYAANNLAKEQGIEDAWDVLMLVIENRAIPSKYTHSYGFHTGNGRYLIETFKEYYYEYTRR